MTDTHTHIYMDEFSFDSQSADSMEGQCATVDRAIEAGVEKMIFPNVDRATIEPMMRLHALRSASTFVAMGLHPTEIKENWRTELDYIMNELRSAPSDFVAVGEVGIDLYWDKTFEREQMLAFDEQMAVASELELPVIIHCREGLDNVLEVIQGHRDVRCVFHSFGGTKEDVERIRLVGDYYFGINGIVTFRNSRLSEVLPAIGADRLLSETDSPYLAPVPNRGKRNESAWIPFIVRKMAEALDLPFGKMAEITTQNANKFFKI